MKDKKPYIEEMAKAVCHLDRTCDECMTSFECKAMMYAKRFYEAGYRKASEVAREIFEEIEEELSGLMNEYHKSQRFSDYDVIRYARCLIAELKKKYTEGEG